VRLPLIITDFYHTLACLGFLSVKGFPLQAWCGSWGFRRLRLLDRLDIRHCEGGKVVTLKHRPPLPPGVFLVLIFRGWVDPRAHGSISISKVCKTAKKAFVMRLVCRSVSQTFAHGGTPKIIVHIPRNPCSWKRKKKKIETALSARSSHQYLQLPQNVLAILWGIFIISWGISKYLCICSTVSVGTSDDVLWNSKVLRNPVRETLVCRIAFSTATSLFSH
jgi:hypothetical protein